MTDKSIPCEPGSPEKVDSVYVRNGAADVFMIAEPLAGRRETVVTERRTAVDSAQILKYTSDVLYPRVEKIILATDNLNIHAEASLYKAFKPEEARRLAERFERHYTPKHGSWLNMAESRSALWAARRLQSHSQIWKALRKRSAFGKLNEIWNAGR